jgi:hypothetical protein
MGFVRVFLLGLIVLWMTSCQHQSNETIATKIQYDVNIVSPDPDYDWWIQNLPGPQRERLVDLIIDGASSGKFPAYDYFNSPITAQQVRMILSDTSYFTLVDEEPPYEERDTVVVYNIRKEDILRIRFLEEWVMDPETLQMNKKILGIAPIARRMDIMGVERWQPLFWVYTDEEFSKQFVGNTE